MCHYLLKIILYFVLVLSPFPSAVLHSKASIICNDINILPSHRIMPLPRQTRIAKVLLVMVVLTMTYGELVCNYLSFLILMVGWLEGPCSTLLPNFSGRLISSCVHGQTNWKFCLPWHPYLTSFTFPLLSSISWDNIPDNPLALEFLSQPLFLGEIQTKRGPMFGIWGNKYSGKHSGIRQVISEMAANKPLWMGSVVLIFLHACHHKYEDSHL